jgi:hypothetical protein
MHKIEYDIKLNESGRPCIELPVDYENNAEDRFFAIEIARYILQDVFARRKSEISESTWVKIEESIAVLGQIGDEIAGILWNNMMHMGETMFLFDKRYHIMVKTVEERDKLPAFIIYDDKIYTKKKDLKVLVADEEKVYKIIDASDEEAIIWEEVK